MIEKIKEKFDDCILSHQNFYSNDTLCVKKEKIYEIISYLKNNLNFEFLMDLTAVDYLNYVEKKKERFEVIYNLYSFENKKRLIIKVPVSEDEPSIKSITSLYQSANWFEREVYDMFGIVFNGHPDLRRILMYEEFEGYPLRKDYPFNKKQPRIQLQNYGIKRED